MKTLLRFFSAILSFSSGMILLFSSCATLTFRVPEYLAPIAMTSIKITSYIILKSVSNAEQPTRI